MTKPVIVHKGRTNILSVGLGYDISADEFASEIREEKDQEADLIATWVITFLTDGTDGELIFTLDDEDTDSDTKSVGWMDLKRITAGEPINVWDEPLEVLFKDTITV